MIPMCKTPISLSALASLMLLTLVAIPAYAGDDLSPADILKNMPAKNARQGAGSAATDAISQRLLSDPKSMEMMQDLQNDPAVQDVLQDPELMRQINQGDVNGASANPKIQALMNNAKINQLIERAK